MASENGLKTTSDVKAVAHGFSGTVSGEKQTKIKSPLHYPKNAPCEQNCKIAVNFPSKMQSQLKKNAVCERALKVEKT